MTGASAGEQPAPVDEVRILHWNVHSWRDPTGNPNQEAIAEVVNDLRPDVVSLVEVDQASGPPGPLDAVAAAGGYSSVFVPALEYGEHQSTGGFGNALLTTLPIHDVRQWLLTRPGRAYDGTEPSESRTVVLARLNTVGTSIWVGSTHLPRSDGAARDDALDRLVALTTHLTEPWLICGDFNIPADAWAGKHAAMAAYPDPPQPSYPSDSPVESIDYCVASPGTVSAARVLACRGSDHLPVLITCLYTDGQR
jgi:endonuclease/exonuclease/phosphatase family metal-dependent hydrolase